MSSSTRDYEMIRGEFFERLIIIKDKRTHRRRVPTEAAATMLIAPEGEAAYTVVIPTTLNNEGGVLLSLTPDETYDIPEGEWQWDMVVTISTSPTMLSTPLQEVRPVSGTITVVSYENITPMDVNPGWPD